eukprot:gene18114-19923_t
MLLQLVKVGEGKMDDPRNSSKLFRPSSSLPRELPRKYQKFVQMISAHDCKGKLSISPLILLKRHFGNAVGRACGNLGQVLDDLQLGPIEFMSAKIPEDGK